ncbi:MAG TPA: hypothetical protein ENG78_04730, partial [Acidiferrobacteraceae bacterium]|nr:hypothetical protein [Acidiferrobacteraceae bacterium]HEX20105.1 hypothetical protein [Acidiferrobacteraceae bacterium]
MSEQLSTKRLLQFFDKKLILSALPMFNRLEGRPRTHDFDRALCAEVRDALWMLTKQWQMGEFKGDDAGSPVSSKVYMEKTMLTKYRPAQHAAEAFDDTVPLETKVEQRKIPFLAGDLEISLDLRLLMGRHWTKLLAKIDPTLKDAYVQHYPIYSPKPDSRDDVYYCASQQSWRKHAATASRHIDGKKLYDDIIDDRERHVDTVGADESLHTDLIDMGERFAQWFDKLFYQPHGETGNDAWLPSNLEYQFACSASNNSGEKVFSAKEYYHGHLDWYNFSIDPETPTLGEVEVTPLPENFDAPIIRSFIPTPIQFDGMPNTRWWAFEEGKTNFGDIQPDTTDINKLLLIEFGLIYANDWYLLPFTLPAGTIANIRGMSVKNVFGENFWITATGKGLDDNPNRWTMYSMDIAGNDLRPADLSLMIVPSVTKIHEGKPIEEIQLARDEVANMVWGIEARIPLPSGESVPGREAARDTLRHLKRIISDSGEAVDGTIEPAANLRYKIMSSVPENWIPFIATHEEGNIRETRLQRGSMPRIIEGDPEEKIQKVKPRTALLREGLNQDEKQSYFINEEEVLRAGVNVTQ